MTMNLMEEEIKKHPHISAFITFIHVNHLGKFLYIYICIKIHIYNLDHSGLANIQIQFLLNLNDHGIFEDNSVLNHHFGGRFPLPDLP